MGLGLILGAAAAGGLQGGGEAGRTAVAANQEAQNKEDLVKMQEEMEAQKDMQIAALNQSYHVQNTATDFANSTTAANAQRTFEGNEYGLNRQNQKDIAAGTNATTITAEGMRAASAELTANISAGASRYAADLTANKLSVTSGANGAYYLTNTNTGKSQQMLDPSGNPIIGVKNIPEGVILTAKSMFDEATLLMHTDPDSQQAKDLTASAKAMLGTGPQPGAKPVDPAMLSMLNSQLQSGYTPTAQDISNFDAAVKQPGAAAAAIAAFHTSGGKAAAPGAVAAPTAAQMATGSAGPAGGGPTTVDQPALIGAPITAAQATAPPGSTPDTTQVPVAAASAPVGMPGGPMPGLVAAQMPTPAAPAPTNFVPRGPVAVPPRQPEPVQTSQYVPHYSNAPGYNHGNQY